MVRRNFGLADTNPGTQVLYISASVWVLQTPNPCQNMLFAFFRMFWQDFNAKMMKDETKRAF